MGKVGTVSKNLFFFNEAQPGGFYWVMAFLFLQDFSVQMAIAKS